MKWPVGTKMDLRLEQLAEGLKGHRFLVKVPDKGNTYVEELVEVTGEYDDLNQRGLEVVIVRRDA